MYLNAAYSVAKAFFMRDVFEVTPSTTAVAMKVGGDGNFLWKVQYISKELFTYQETLHLR